MCKFFVRLGYCFPLSPYMMHENIDEEIAVSSDFDDLNFGVANVEVPFGERKTVASVVAKTSLNAELICGVLKNCCVTFLDYDSSPLRNHIIGFDDCSKKLFLRADIHFENLDNGTDLLTRESLLGFQVFSCKGDFPFQIIPKNIGGFDSARNVFPLNPEVDLTQWNIAITKIYDHVKAGEENCARIIYVLNYAYDNGNSHGERPAQIFYNFKLYKNGELSDRGIEGKILNPMPRRSVYKVNT